MIKAITTFFVLCSFSTAYSQDCFDKIALQAVQIDSLQKAMKTERDSSLQLKLKYNKDNKGLLDTINKLKTNLLVLNKFSAEKSKLDTQLRHKSDSIALLIKHVSEVNQQISNEKQLQEKINLEAYDRGKNEVLSIIVNFYQKEKFDDLLDSLSQIVIRRDIQLVGSNAEIKKNLHDLEVYFNSEELLTKKIDAAQIKNVQRELAQIKRQSNLFDKQKQKFDIYQSIYDGLKETMGKIIALDGEEKVSDLSTEIQENKYTKILVLISSYLFKYDVNSIDYPYISDIVLEVIKAKKSNADKDITDLLKKL